MNLKNPKELLVSHPDYIEIKRFDNSLKKLLAQYPEGVTNKVIAQALGIEEVEVDTLYQSIVAKLKVLMGVK